ncbi:MAG TPA: enhanced serine sensitivity protein SseB [Streptosporangiaceae bacterium]|jgi:hypothetical protein|nr:enhanced serine sensitivity protein SseB [Streptosporangiaceae bacterium]
MPFPSNGVEQTLAAARAGEVTDERLLDSLAEADLWVPLPAGESEGRGALPIMVIDDVEYVVVYTSEEQFKLCAGKYSAAVTPGRAFARSLPPELGIAVNPGGEVGLPIQPVGVQVIRGEEIPADAGSQILLGEPAEEPSALLDVLRGAFAAVPEIASARRAWSKVGDQQEGLLLGIELTPDDERTRRSALEAVTAALARSPVSHPVDSAFLGDPGDPIAAWFVRNTEPFYIRSA